MKRPVNFWRFALRMGVGVIGCFVIQAWFGFYLGWFATKTESNYFSTIVRFQASAGASVNFAFAGSSITGRLPGREAGDPEVANLGSDGSGAIDGIRVLVESSQKRPQWLVVETNTIFAGSADNEGLVLQASRGLWFRVGARLPLLGATARPTGMLYGRLLNRTEMLSSHGFNVLTSKLPDKEDANWETRTRKERDLIEQFAVLLEILHRQGVRVILANYPAGTPQPREANRINAAIRYLSTRVTFDYVDLAAQIPRANLNFTDQVHLAPSSAAALQKTIKDYCRSLDTSQFARPKGP